MLPQISIKMDESSILLTKKVVQELDMGRSTNKLGWKNGAACCKITRGVRTINSGIWGAIFVSAILAFGVAIIYEQPVHWFLFVLLLVIGFFIHTVILILTMEDENP